MNLAELKTAIEEYPIRLGVCVNFDGHKFYGYREDEKFDSACSIMAFILLEYMNQFTARNFSGKELVTYNEENFATGSGIIKFLPFGSQIRLEDLAELMTAASDHVAANLLIDVLGIDSINNTIRTFGFVNTILNKKFLIPKVKNIGTCSPKDYTNFFTMLKNNSLVSSKVSELIKKILLKQKYKDILAEKILEDDSHDFFIDVASKSGKADGKIYDNFTDSYIADGGIIYTQKGTYEISMFAELDYDAAFSLNQIKSFMQMISLNVFKIYLNN